MDRRPLITGPQFYAAFDGLWKSDDPRIARRMQGRAKKSLGTYYPVFQGVSELVYFQRSFHIEDAPMKWVDELPKSNPDRAAVERLYIIRETRPDLRTYGRIECLAEQTYCQYLTLLFLSGEYCPPDVSSIGGMLIRTKRVTPSDIRDLQRGRDYLDRLFHADRHSAAE